MKYARFYKATKEAEARIAEVSLEERLERISNKIYNQSNVPAGFHNSRVAYKEERP